MPVEKLIKKKKELMKSLPPLTNRISKLIDEKIVKFS